MSKLIKNQKFIPDPFTYLETPPEIGAETPSEIPSELPDGAIIVSLDRLKTDADSLQARNVPIGVVIRADNQGKTKIGEDVRDLIPYLNNLSVIALEFPTFRNGRGYTSARILRDELKYEGEIRAIGDVSYDQLAYMQRCGIDAFEVNDDVTLEQFAGALGELSDAYQPASPQQKKPEQPERGIIWRRK